MRYPIIILLLLSVISLSSATIRIETTIDQNNILNLVSEQLELGPRIPGSEGAIAFEQWIVSKTPSGWNTLKQEFRYNNTTLNNYLVSTSTKLPPILLASHWDSRAVADNDPNIFNRDKPVPAANDGASSVAGLLELLRHIPEQDADQVGFIFFDGEDQGSGGMDGWDWIVGSTYFANSLTEEEVNQTQALILLDMIGDDELNLPFERRSTKTLVSEIWGIAEELGYGNIFINESGYSLIDDHIPFKKRGIPVVDIIDFDYPEWHTVNDDLDHISAESIAIVIDVVLEWLRDNFFSVTNFTPRVISTSEEVPLSIISLVTIFFLRRHSK